MESGSISLSISHVDTDCDPDSDSDSEGLYHPRFSGTAPTINRSTDAKSVEQKSPR